MKRGLKRDSRAARMRQLSIVEETSPMKRGLKVSVLEVQVTSGISR